jgi:hypothetical protein
MMNTITLSKSIPQAEWGKFFDQFSSDHRGQHIEIEIVDPEFDDEELIKNAPLLSMIYDRPGKGDNLAIEVGKKEMTYGHTIDSPKEISTGENSIKEIVAIQIKDANGRKTLIKLEGAIVSNSL